MILMIPLCTWGPSSSPVSGNAESQLIRFYRQCSGDPTVPADCTSAWRKRAADAMVAPAPSAAGVKASVKLHRLSYRGKFWADLKSIKIRFFCLFTAVIREMVSCCFSPKRAGWQYQVYCWFLISRDTPDCYNLSPLRWRFFSSSCSCLWSAPHMP